MHTDNLSREAYKAVLLTAEAFNHDLTLQFGLLSYHCSGEDDYLNEAELLIMDWLQDPDLQVEMEDIFFDELPPLEEFRKTLKTILDNISNVKQIPIQDRVFDK